MVNEELLLEKAMPLIALEIENELKLEAPVNKNTEARDRSNLRRSIIVNVTKKGIQINMDEYGKYVEFGTPPHVITPKNGKALAFMVGGKKIIVKKVNHPGTRPNNFIRRTLRAKLPGIIQRNMERFL